MIALIGVGHFLSHFYIMALPPLFPLLKEAFAVSYFELGLALGLMNLTTGLTQLPVGFLVDRIGPRRILISGISMFAAAIMMIGMFPTYPALIACMILAGLGNSVFHPADYSILSATVDDRRIGRAFSIHTFAGFAGFAAAPPALVALTAWIGWQLALIVSGGFGMMVAFLMLANRDVLNGEQAPGGGKAAAGSGLYGGGARFLLSLPMLSAFALFIMLALSHGGLTSFSVASLKDLYQLPLAAATLPLTAYLLASTVGVLVGGVIADRLERQDYVASGYMVLIALAITPVAAFSLALWQLISLLAIAGFFAGAVTPSRDMMVRAITPPGASGRVFGFVTSGFNIGGIVTPLIFGSVMDQGMPRLVFWLVVLFSLLTLIVITSAARFSSAGKR